jgi:aminoglycoside 3-N-acetyltransferase
MAYAGWEDDSYNVDDLSPEWRAAYEDELPPFDPATSEATRDNGRLPERIRTWPAAHRSRQPEASVVAVGARAAWITAEHPWDDPYGPGSPLAKLVEAEGQVLMLGAPLETITLLHHAEATARVAEKRRVIYRMPLLEESRVVWRTFHDIDTSTGAFDYALVADEIARTPGCGSETDAFEALARQALLAGIGRHGTIGEGMSHLFPARELHAFAERWLEQRFSAAPGSPAREGR